MARIRQSGRRAGQPGRGELARPAAGLGVGVVAAVCCVGLPALAAVVGSLTLGALIGVGAGLAAILGLLGAAVLFVRPRRQRASATEPNRRRGAS